VIVTLTGTVSDFDKDGLFGLLVADDGSLLPFNLRETRLRCAVDLRLAHA
jgi:hypothetical protein